MNQSRRYRRLAMIATHCQAAQTAGVTKSPKESHRNVAQIVAVASKEMKM